MDYSRILKLFIILFLEYKILFFIFFHGRKKETIYPLYYGYWFEKIFDIKIVYETKRFRFLFITVTSLIISLIILFFFSKVEDIIFIAMLAEFLSFFLYLLFFEEEEEDDWS